MRKHIDDMRKHIDDMRKHIDDMRKHTSSDLRKHKSNIKVLFRVNKGALTLKSVEFCHSTR